MNSLDTLIKLQKTRVDEQRQMLAKLQNYLDQIDAEIATLKDRMVVEQRAYEENPGASMTYGAFLKSSIEKQRELDKNREAAAAAVEIARDRLAQQFEEQKRYELALEQQNAQEAAEELRRDNAEYDEIGSVNFTRKQTE